MMGSFSLLFLPGQGPHYLQLELYSTVHDTSSIIVLGKYRQKVVQDSLEDLFENLVRTANRSWFCMISTLERYVKCHESLEYKGKMFEYWVGTVPYLRPYLYVIKVRLSRYRTFIPKL